MPHYRYSITIPVQDSEGNARNDVWQATAQELTDLFGGVTVSPEQTGYWKSPETDSLVHDQVRVLSTLTDQHNALSLVQSRAHEVAVSLKQEAVLITAEVVHIVEFIEQ